MSTTKLSASLLHILRDFRSSLQRDNDDGDFESVVEEIAADVRDLESLAATLRAQRDELVAALPRCQACRWATATLKRWRDGDTDYRCDKCGGGDSWQLAPWAALVRDIKAEGGANG